VKITVAAKGAFTGKVVLGGTTHAFTGVFDQEGVARFGATKTMNLVIKRGSVPNALLLSLRWNPSSESGTITGMISDPTAFVCSFRADRALFTAAKKPVAPQLNVPTD